MVWKAFYPKPLDITLDPHTGHPKFHLSPYCIIYVSLHASYWRLELGLGLMTVLSKILRYKTEATRWTPRVLCFLYYSLYSIVYMFIYVPCVGADVRDPLTEVRYV